MSIRVRPHLEQLPAYVPGRSAVEGFETVVKLSSNETPYPPLPSVQRAIAEAAAALHRYPDDGTTALRQAIATHFGVTAEQVGIGAGSVALCLQAVLTTAGPGDEVLFGWPSFDAYPLLAAIAGATAVRVPLSDQCYDLTAMAEQVTEATRTVFVCNPNNPTGTLVDGEVVRRFVAAIPADCLVVVDEAYREYVSRPGFVDGLSLLDEFPNVAVLRTFSKAYGLAGLRVGYCIAAADVVRRINQTRLPFSVGTLAQVAAVQSIAGDDELAVRMAELVDEREWLAERLRGLGFTVPDSEANFVWLPVGEDAPDLFRRIERHGVVVRSFPPYGVRITVGTHEENERVVAALEHPGG